MSRYYPVSDDLLTFEAVDYSLNIGGHRLGFTEYTWGPPSPNSEAFTVAYFGPVSFTAPVPVLVAWGIVIVIALLFLCALLVGRTLLRQLTPLASARQPT